MSSQPQTTPITNQPPAPDAGLTDDQLQTQVRNELATARQASMPRSPWAAAFGPPTLKLGGGAGEYSVDPEQLRNVITGWQNILNRLEGYDSKIRIIANASSAAEDDASSAANGAIQNTGAALQNTMTSIKTYAAGQISKLAASLHNYELTEQLAADSLRQQDVHG